MTRLLSAVIFLILLSIGSVKPVLADDVAEPADPARIGPYAAVAAAYDWTTTFDGDGKTGGVNARLGFRFWKYVSAEAEYEWGASNPGSWTAGGSFKGFPFTGAVQPFVLLGASYWHLDTRGSDVGVRFGAGVDGHVSDHFFLTAGVDYVWGLRDLSGVNFCTLYAGVGFQL